MKATCSFCGKGNELSPGEMRGLCAMIKNVLDQQRLGMKDVAGAMKISLECGHCKRTYSAEITPDVLSCQEN